MQAELHAPEKPHAPLGLLGLCCGVGVSTIYLCQPLLPDMGASFGAGAAAAGQIGVATQVGYAAGMLCFVPLGDTLERRGLIRRMFGAVSVALLLLALAPSLTLLLLLCAAAGSLACVTHIVLPIAPDLAKPNERGRALGVVMTGLLMGVLLARTFSGWVADLAGMMTTRIASWRVVFLLASLISVVLTVTVGRVMPLLPPKENLSYGQAMRSLWTLLRAEPVLRESCLIGALGFGAFSAFWNTLAFVLAGHSMGAAVTGTFGLVGAGGTLAAKQAGKMADQRGSRLVIAGSIALLMLSFAGIYLTERFSVGVQRTGHGRAWLYLLLLTAMVVLLDVGMQAMQLANQTRIFALQPAARSRINTLYMTSYFIGAAVCSALAPILWQHFHSLGLFGFETVLMLIAVLRHVTGVPQPAHVHIAAEDDEPMLHA